MMASRLILGIGVILVGLLLTLDNFEILEADDLFLYWPAILIAVGISKLFGRNPYRLLFAAALIGLGSWILLFNLEVVAIQPWDFFWPVLLILGGAALTMGALRHREPVATDPNSTVSGLAFLSGVERKSSSADFRGGEMTAVLGGYEVDLRQAKIAEGSHPVLGVFALWGGIEIRVPEDWSIDVQVTPLLGAYEDSTKNQGSGGPCLTIKGMAIMGGIEVTN